MLTSMTGFGRAEQTIPKGGRLTAEVHSLNHRFLEVECRLPDGFQGYEAAVREIVSGSLRRGRVRVTVSIRTVAAGKSLQLQTDVARRYVKQLTHFKRQLKMKGEIDLAMLLGLPEILTSTRIELVSEKFWPILKRSLERALKKTVALRRAEGARLAQTLLQSARSMRQLHQKIERRVKQVQAGQEKKWVSRMEELLGQGIGDSTEKSLLIKEAASLIQSTDVSEELVRIDSHLSALRKAVDEMIDHPGKTIDFLAQELHREVNTIGSKVRDGQVVQWVVAMKNEIEKLREQAANVE